MNWTFGPTGMLENQTFSKSMNWAAAGRCLITPFTHVNTRQLAGHKLLLSDMALSNRRYQPLKFLAVRVHPQVADRPF